MWLCCRGFSTSTGSKSEGLEFNPFACRHARQLPSLNLPGLDVVDFRETATEYHVRAKPKVVSRQCPSCGPAGKVVIHEHKTLSTKGSVTVNGVAFEVPLSKFNGQPYVPTAYPSGR